MPLSAGRVMAILAMPLHGQDARGTSSAAPRQRRWPAPNTAALENPVVVRYTVCGGVLRLAARDPQRNQNGYHD